MSCLKMVFEAVVSSQLNKFLGDYIENLNSSQLKVGLLGGKPFLPPPPLPPFRSQLDTVTVLPI